MTSEVINKIIPVLKKTLFKNLCSTNKSLSRLTSLNQFKITKIEIKSNKLKPTFIDKYRLTNLTKTAKLIIKGHNLKLST
jgi:hypothetical protein